MKDKLLVGAIFVIAGGLTARAIQVIKERKNNEVNESENDNEV